MTTTIAAPETIPHELVSGLDQALDLVLWAEEEIAAAQQRHPDHADTLWHAFSLLSTHQPRRKHETVYRSHAREILDRVAAGEDTRPATAAEIVCGLLDAATLSPIVHDGYALLIRMWHLARMPHDDDIHDQLAHLETITSSITDRNEQAARTKLATPTRTMSKVITCTGQHHTAQTVACRYTQTGTTSTRQLANQEGAHRRGPLD